MVSSGHICLSYLHLPKPSNFSICGVLENRQEKGSAEAIILLIIKCIHKYLLTTHSVVNTVTWMISLAARFIHPRGICKCFWKKLKWLYFTVLRTSPGTSWMMARGTGWGTFLDKKISFGADTGSISLKNRICYYQCSSPTECPGLDPAKLPCILSLPLYFFNFIYLFIYFWLRWDFVAVCGLLIALASLVAEHGL